MDFEKLLGRLTDQDLLRQTSRRNVLRGLAGLGVTVIAPPFFAACDSKPKGSRPIDDKLLYQIYDTLDQTGRPLLKKVVAGMQTCRSLTQQRPPGIPEWVAKSSFPLPITIEDINESQARLMAYGIKSVEYVINGGGKSQKFSGVAEEYEWSINLAYPPKLNRTTLLAVSMAAAKEYLGLLTETGIGEDFYNIFQQASGVTLTDTKGDTITDPNTQKLVGLDLYYNSLKNLNSPHAMLADRFPMLLLVPEIVQLQDASKLPADLFGYLPYMPTNIRTYRAAGNEVKQQLSGVTSQWINSDNIMLPATLLRQTYTRPLYDLTLQTRTM